MSQGRNGVGKIIQEEIGNMREEPKQVEVAAGEASARLTKVALALWKEDVHEFSSRPCSTCRLLSVVIGEAWGCLKIKS